MEKALWIEQKRNFSLAERFHWANDEEFRQLKNALTESPKQDYSLIASNGQAFRCHRCILSAASPFFEAMFKSGMRECCGEVKLQFSSETIKEFLSYLYKGQLNITESTFEPLFFMTHLLQLQAALAFVTDMLSSSTERDNAVQLFDLATSFNIPQLRVSVVDYILSFPVSEIQFKELPFALVHLLVDKDELRVEHEGQVVETILAWIRHNPNERDQYRLQLLQCVRLPHLRLTELEYWRNDGIGSLELLKTLSESVDWNRQVNAKMLTRRTHSEIHIHSFWAEDCLTGDSFETMHQRNEDQPLYMFESSQYSIICSCLGKECKQEIASCSNDYLSHAGVNDGVIIRQDWTKRLCYAVGPDLYFTNHDTLRMLPDMGHGSLSSDYDLEFLKVPMALNGLVSSRRQCTGRRFNLGYLKSRICCATEYKGEIVFVLGAFSDADGGEECFFIKICVFNPNIDTPAHDDEDDNEEVECLSEAIELFEEYIPICCVVTHNDKLAVLSAHDIKIFDLSDTSTTVTLEYSISLEFEIGVSSWVKDDIIYIYLVDRLNDVFEKTDEQEPPKMHYISGYSVTDSFDKVFQHKLDFVEKNVPGYPKDVRSFVVRDTVYIIYKAIPQYKIASSEGLYIYRYAFDSQTVEKVDRFEVLRFAEKRRSITSSTVYEKDLVALVPSDMCSCEHSTLLEDFCHRYSLDNSCNFSNLASLRKYQL